MLSDLTPKSQRQASLWHMDADELPQQRSERLVGVLDEINRRFGRGTLKIGSMGTAPAWTMKRERVSPRYTTRWGDIPKVLAR